MAELHVVGEIVGAMGFEDRNLFCKVRPRPVSRALARPRVSSQPPPRVPSRANVSNPR